MLLPVLILEMLLMVAIAVRTARHADMQLQTMPTGIILLLIIVPLILKLRDLDGTVRTTLVFIDLLLFLACMWWFWPGRRDM